MPIAAPLVLAAVLAAPAAPSAPPEAISGKPPARIGGRWHLRLSAVRAGPEGLVSYS
jgi:hypothetical protein